VSGAAIVILDPGAENVATPLVRSAFWYVQHVVEFLFTLLHAVARPRFRNIHSKIPVNGKSYWSCDLISTTPVGVTRYVRHIMESYFLYLVPKSIQRLWKHLLSYQGHHLRAHRLFKSMYE
jgi:hypothetical protein